MRLGYVTLAGRGRTDELLAGVASLLEHVGMRLAGTVQTNLERVDRSKCDMDLRVLPDGPVLRISQDLGEGSRGCRLHTGVLETAVAEVQARLDGAEVLVVNKFGKQEALGRGLAPVIAEALSRGMTVLVGVNGLNVPAFMDFTGEGAKALPPDPAAIVAWVHDATIAEAA